MNPFRTGKLVLFQVTYDRDWHFFEIIFFIIIGIFGVSETCQSSYRQPTGNHRAYTEPSSSSSTSKLPLSVVDISRIMEWPRL